MLQYGAKRTKWFCAPTAIHLTSWRQNPAVALEEIYFWYHPTTTTPKKTTALFTPPVKSSKTWCQRLRKPNEDPPSSTAILPSNYGSHSRIWESHSLPPPSKATITTQKASWVQPCNKNGQNQRTCNFIGCRIAFFLNSSTYFGNQDQQILEIIIWNTMRPSIIIILGHIIFTVQRSMRKLMRGNACAHAVTGL